MEILELPERTKYYGNSVGNYHLYGMELRLTYEDGSTVDVRHDGDGWYDYDYNWYTIDSNYTGEYEEDGKYDWCYAQGEQTVELSCGSASTVFSIDVLGITELSVVEAPSCTEYWREIDSDIYYAWDGIVLDAVFSDGSTGELTFGFEGWQLDGDYVYELEEEVLTEGEENVREMCLSVGGKEITFPITQKRVQSIEITKLPTQTVLIGGWKEASMYGIGLKVVLTDGTSDVIQYDYNDMTRRYEWQKSDGTSVISIMGCFYQGAYREDDYFAYGVWPVEMNLDGKTTIYQIEVKDYPRHQCGTLVLGNKNEISLEEDHYYEYTFVPKEDGLYRYETVEGYNKIDINTYCGTERVTRNSGVGSFVLYAGKTYKIEIFADYVDSDDAKVSVALMKSNVPMDETIAANETKAVSFSENERARLYTFVPKVSGTYLLYSDGASDNLDPYVEFYGSEMNRKWDEDDDNYQIEDGHEYNFGLRAYLTAGQTYHYLVCVRKNNYGTLKITMKQEADTCRHVWESEEKYDSTCGAAGVSEERCVDCGMWKYTEIPRKPHTLGAATVLKEANVLEEGMKQSDCSVCKQTVRTAIPKLTPVLKLNAASIPLKVKQSTTALKVTEMAKGDAVVSWTSSKPKIVKVTNAGKITAGKKTGKAVLTVRLKSGKTANVTVKVQKKKVTTKKVKAAAKKVTLKKGQNYTLAPVITPITTQDKVTYSTSKKGVATVSKKGVVKAKKPGTAKITIKSGKKKAVVTVKVTKK